MALADDLRELLEGSSFYRWSGIEVVRAEAGEVTLGLEIVDHHRNVQGFAHGGVLATLADAAMGLSVRTAMEPGRRHVTVAMGVHYLRPVTGGSVTAAGRSGSGARSPTPRRWSPMRAAATSPARAARTA